MRVRLAEPGDLEKLVDMRAALWPEGTRDEHHRDAEAIVHGRPLSTMPLVVFVADDPKAGLRGFVEVGLRSHADGCDPIRPSAFIEGWWVEAGARGTGIGRALIQAAEDWGHAQGATEIGSDTWAENEASRRAHEALGFELVDTCANYKKSLVDLPAGEGAGVHYGHDLAEIHHRHFGMLARAGAKLLRERLQGVDPASGSILELGCGSGISGALLVAAGHRVEGVDISPAMLTIARRHAPGVQLRTGSAWTCELGEAQSRLAVTAFGEVLNYTAEESRPRPEALRSRCREIFECLRPGGLFVFDLSGPGRSGATGRRLGVWEHEDAIVYLEETEIDKEQRLTRDIHSFLRAGALHRRHREKHCLALHEAPVVESMLLDIGFEVERLDGYGDFSFGPGWAGFVARKA